MVRSLVSGLMVAVLFCTCFTGCGSDQTNAVKKQISLLNELADDLEKIKSNAALVDEKPELEKLAAKFADHENEVKKLPKPSNEEIKKMQADYKQDFDRALARVEDNMKRINKDVSPKASMEITDALKSGPGSLTVHDWLTEK